MEKYMNRKSLLRILLIFSFLTMIQNLTISVLAQDISDKEVDQIKKAKEIAEAKKAIAEAEKAEMAAKFPDKPDAEALVGGTTVKGEFIENRILGYCAMKTAAQKIVARINPTLGAIPIQRGLSFLPPGSTLVVYNEDDVKMLSRYTLLRNRLKILEDGYTQILLGKAAPPPAVVGAIPSIINTVMNFLTLLKTDIDLTGKEFDIDEKELVAEVFSRLQGRGYTLYYPKTIPLSLRICESPNYADCSPLLQQIVNVAVLNDRAKRARLADFLSSEEEKLRVLLEINFDVTMTELGLKEPPKPTPTPTPTSTPCPTPCPTSTPCPTPCPTSTPCSASSCSTTVNVTTAEKKDEKKDEGGGGGGKTFLSYIQAETLFNVMKDEKSYWIDLKVIKAGGNMRIKTNFITNFIYGARVNFSGGAIVYFNIFGKRGTSEVSEVIPIYEKYRKSSRINEKCGTVDD
jgi:hypothetical protein